MTVARLMEGLSLDDKELKDGHLSFLETAPCIWTA